MPFSVETKTKMFIASGRLCCLCLKQCGTNIEAAHIISEANGGENTFENGIPVCFDCHQEIGAYDNQHPRGNRFTPTELKTRRDKVYASVESGALFVSGSKNELRLEDVPIRGGDGALGPGGDVRVTGAPGQVVTIIGGSMTGGTGGTQGGKGGDVSIEGGAGIDADSIRNHERMRVIKSASDPPPFLVRLHKGSDVLAILAGACASSLENDDLETEEELELVTEFLQESSDLGEMAATLEVSERVRGVFRLDRLISRLHSAGFWVFGAREKRMIVGGGFDASDWPIGIIRVLRESNPQIERIDVEDDVAMPSTD